LQGSKIFKWAVTDDTAAQIVRPPSDLKIVTLAPGTYKASFTEASGVAGPQQYAVKVQFGSRPAAMHVVPDGQTSVTFNVVVPSELTGTNASPLFSIVSRKRSDAAAVGNPIPSRAATGPCNPPSQREINALYNAKQKQVRQGGGAKKQQPALSANESWNLAQKHRPAPLRSVSAPAPSGAAAATAAAVATEPAYDADYYRGEGHDEDYDEVEAYSRGTGKSAVHQRGSEGGGIYNQKHVRRTVANMERQNTRGKK
jgi:hypothetical protein